MKMLYPLTSDEHQLLKQGFAEWLSTLGYAATSVRTLPGHVQEFLHNQEARGKYSLGQLVAGDAAGFIRQQQTSIGIRTGRVFSAGHLNKYIQALHLFSRYIRESGRSGVGFRVERLEDTREKPTWLTRAEIGRLYEATEPGVLGMRDRAMLSVFYGCGLRLQEGAGLACKDILGERRMLHVRAGKGYRERYVPVAEKSYRDILVYTTEARPQLLQEPCGVLFIDAHKGRPIHKQSLYLRIKGLVRKASIQKRVGTHTLRHSIATHLLQSGMPLERIQEFLGHSALDSTQLYTHLVHEPIP
jgi:site-specific recombinase XerD